MFPKSELDLVPGVYKCYGDVDNLRFKVHLEIIKSSMIPLSGIEEQDSGLDPQYYEQEEFELSWNEKIFSSRELDLYKDEKNCRSPLELEYYEKIKALTIDGGNSPRRVFTYTSKEQVPAKLHRNVFYNQETNRSFFHKAPLHPFLRNFNSPVETYDSRNILPVKNIINYYPSDLQRQENRSLSSGYEIMYIVADLSDKNEKSDRKDEENADYLLFTIMWNKRTLTLSVTPDFAAFSTPGYKIDVDKSGDTRYVYRYWLLNISTSEDQTAKTTENLNEQIIAHQNLNFSVDFELPAKNTCLLFYFIEIQKIQGFLGDSLFVQYFIHLPSRWTAENPTLLYGITHQCRPRRKNDAVKFSSVFEIKLCQEICELNENIDCQQVDAPQIFFEVCSLDSWKRFRVEGYSWMLFPTSSGCHQIVLDSWRPVSCGRRAQLQRFFTGGDCEIADIRYPGLKCEGSILARYGFDTMSSGRIHLIVNSIQQTCLEITKPKRTVYSLNSWKSNKLMDNVNSILEAFKKARQRMISMFVWDCTSPFPSTFSFYVRNEAVVSGTTVEGSAPLFGYEEKWNRPNVFGMA